MNNNVKTMPILILMVAFFSTSAQNILTGDLESQRDSIRQHEMSISHPSQMNQSMKIYTEYTLDESDYVIGSGDIFHISFVSTPSLKYYAAVDQNGNLYIPDLGMIKVGFLTLKEAKLAIKDYLSQNTKQKSFYIKLTHPKDIQVFFNGVVDSPGSQRISGARRLLDGLKMANKGEMPKISEIDLRNVQCIKKDTVLEYDILSYIYKNDKSQNPYLYSEDVIRLKPALNRVFISGPLRYPSPGMYPIKENETLHDFLSLFVLDSSADLENIIIQRTIEGITETQTISSENVVLKNMDAIIIPAKDNYPDIHTINVGGEIASPGIYPIKEDITTAKMILDQAGGVTPQGNIDQAVILRHGRKLPEHFNKGATSLSGVRPELGTSLAMISSTDDHLVIKLKERGLDVILEPGDQIVIPKKDKYVYLSGNVKKPGAVEYTPGKNCSHYIRQAGGFNGKADKSNIQAFVKYGSAVQAVETENVEPGSIIVVPASQQYKFFSTVFIPLISALATTVGVGVAIYNSR